MSWWAVDVRSPLEQRDAVAAWLVGHTGQTVEEREDGILVSVTPGREQAGALRHALRGAFGPSVATSSERALPDVDWRLRWRDGLAPRRVGRLTITPSWIAPDREATGVVVIDPETAFGTGEHGSTRAALRLLDRAIQPGHRVLDLGSGSGILAIAAVRLGAVRATGIDIDPETESVARANAERNGVADRVDFLTGDAAALAPLLGPADLLLSNILRSLNEALLPVVRAALAPGGTAIFAGMEQTERAGFLSALAAAGLVAGDEATDESWWGVTARGA